MEGSKTRNQTHLAQFHLLQGIRNFFASEDFLDVMTPPVVENPGMETHIHPFQIKSAFGGKVHDSYLHTSPEFAMKQLLAEGLDKIFTLTYCFRDEPSSYHHRNQFIMLEWYRTNSDYNQIMDDTEGLISYCYDYLQQKGIPVAEELKSIEFKRMTIQEIFLEILNVDILNYLEKDNLVELIQTQFPDVPLGSDIDKLTWDDCYFLLFLNKIETELVNYPYLLLYEFPHHLSALSTIKEDDPRVCQRFEVYMNGLELCNCFNELRDIKIQKERFNDQAIEKKELYNYELPTPNVLYQSLEDGFPPSGGIALGVERLLMALTPLEDGFWS